MKQNKRRTATVVYIFIFMLTVSGCVRKGKEQDKVYQETGMFEWSEEAVCEPEEALYLAKELGITKWYQETNGMTEVEATGKFVKALHNRKIEVYALLGAVEWGYEEDGATLLAHLEKIVQYNVQSSEKEKFDGVMLDITVRMDIWYVPCTSIHWETKILKKNWRVLSVAGKCVCGFTVLKVGQHF